MIIKEIPGCSGYYVDKEGNVYSKKTGQLNKLATYYDSNNRYELIKLICDNGKRKSFLVHRIVASVFMKNPHNYSDVHHIDGNPHNNNVNNLQWVSHKENIHESYKTLSQTRNYISADLYKGDQYVGTFRGIKAAVRYAQAHFGTSSTGLEKNLRCGNVYILINKKSRKIQYDGTIRKTRNRNPWQISRCSGEYIGTFRTMKDVRLFLNSVYKTETHGFKPQHREYDNNRSFYGFVITRMQSKGVTTSSYERTADGELRWEVH